MGMTQQEETRVALECQFSSFPMKTKRQLLKTMNVLCHYADLREHNTPLTLNHYQ